MSTSFTRNVKLVTGGRYTKIVKDVGGAGGGGGTASGGTSDRPVSGAETGAMYFDTDVDKLYVWNGSAWVDVT